MYAITHHQRTLRRNRLKHMAQHFHLGAAPLIMIRRTEKIDSRQDTRFLQGEAREVLAFRRRRNHHQPLLLPPPQ